MLLILSSVEWFLQSGVRKRGLKTQTCISQGVTEFEDPRSGFGAGSDKCDVKL